MSLKTLVSVADEGPWCGTHYPGWRPHPPRRAVVELEAELMRHGVARLEPDPNPWRTAAVATNLYAAIAMYQVGRKIGGEEGIGVGAASESFYDDTCGSVPFNLLLWILTHQPPPPPPPWLQDILTAANTIVLAKGFAAGPVKDGLLVGAGQQLKVSLKGLEGQQQR